MDDNNELMMRPDSVRVQLYQNGVALGDVARLNRANGWAQAYADLPVADKNDQTYIYTVRELAVQEGYYVTYRALNKGILEIVNVLRLPDLPYVSSNLGETFD